MHVAPNADTVPSVVNRHLLPFERQVISIHRHPAVLVLPFLAAAGGLIAASVLSALSALSGDALLLTWLLWGLAVLYAAWKLADWLVSYYVVTGHRMMLIKGFLARDVAMVPLALVVDMRFRRSALGRLLGYGQFILESSGRNQGMRTLNFLPYPEQLYLEVCGLIFREVPEDEGGEEISGDSGGAPGQAE
jgi:membrane protein YdbS with pleckstrin-like domain